jgi:type II secretory pathway component PulF
MDSIIENIFNAGGAVLFVVFKLGAGALLLGFGLALTSGWLFLFHFLLTLPMRRAERARLFLDVVETALKRGQPVEEALISLSQTGDLSMGAYFHLLAAWLEKNLRLGEALAKVPRFLPPQISAMLAAGQKIGDLGRVLPACRQLLKDAVSQTRGAISYLVILTFVITPIGVWVFCVLQIVVFPKFMELVASFGGDSGPVVFLREHRFAVIALQFLALFLLWLATLIYVGGPRVVSWFPILERLHYRLPWRQKRMQRDFSTMLAILLDSGVPEPEAVALAADCAANRVFRRRAARAVDGLQQGLKLAQAVQSLDDSGEFGWRLANAFHGGGSFLRALTGWHESLDAKAFQQEQAASHGITTALVFWSGLFVGAVVISVFMFLISIINAGVLW